MTGPDYPRPVPGSNAIGKFKVGVSPIGTMVPFDAWLTIISQYGNSPILTALITNFQQYVDQTKNLDQFYDLMMNVDTAQGYGLDVWGRIVGVTRTLQIASGSFFGFAEGAPSYQGFNTASFYSGVKLTQNYNLSDNAYRTLIFAKAMANITNGSIPSINHILMSLFPHRGNAYVTEGPEIGGYFGFEEAVNAQGFNQAPFYSGAALARMTMTYTFEFVLTAVEYAIVVQSGVLPKPTGVKASVVQI